MNKKCAFFYCLTSALFLFTAAKAFCVFVTLTLKLNKAQTAALCSCIRNYIVAQAIFNVITISMHPPCPFEIYKAALGQGYKNLVHIRRRFSTPATVFLFLPI